MIITRTPLRISFAGGGSDFPEFYRRHGGAVLTTAIDKYVHVILQDRFDGRIRIGYSKTEIADTVDQLEHELVRESMRLTGVEGGIEISTMADVPSTGSGLGSSSSVTVGLLNALHTYRDDPQTKERLARQAVEVEIEVLEKPIGKQDQYIAAYGNLRKIRFEPDDSVLITRVPIPANAYRALSERLMLFYTGLGRDASTVLSEQSSRIEKNSRSLRIMVDMVEQMEQFLLAGELDEFGCALDHCWRLKKGLATKVSTSDIDDMYSRAIRAGALGGKVTGAGGGGFMLLYCDPARRKSVRDALGDLIELPFNLEPDGSKVVFSN